ncbi:MAG TPA: recombinase family protein [Candidatus Wunengus sp. YC63]|uniref:recombinase family protein n=1 Tax=unclassified Candidatus Wunengus TaxID=3367695 RepID=UPI004026EF12
MGKALLYIRVSSKEQEKEGYSLDAQEKLGLAYASRKNLNIDKIWKVSESAWDEGRTAFNQMIECAKRHNEIKHIIFDITDRMTRNDFDKLKIYNLIYDHDKTIHFSRTNKMFNKDSSPDDEFMFDIEVAVAKKMSNDISRKTRMGMLEKAEQGLYPSNAPLGYKNNPVTGLIEEDLKTAFYIKDAFSLMATGSYSLSMLANKLFNDGLRGKTSNRIGESTLHHLLKNPFYYGVFKWKDKMYQGGHTPLTTKDLFEKVQNVLTGNFHPYSNRKNFHFNNMIICGICGCKVLGEEKRKKGKEYKYYHCTFSKGRHTGVGYIREEILAEMFEKPIKNITLDNEIAEWLIEGLKEHKQNNFELQENRYNALNDQYGKIKKRLSKLYDSKFDGEINEEIFKAKEVEYKNQLTEIESQMDGLQVIGRDFYELGHKTFELSKMLYSQYVRANYEDKAKILKFIASNYTLNDVSLCPKYRKPFDIIAEGLSHINWLPR